MSGRVKVRLVEKEEVEGTTTKDILDEYQEMKEYLAN